jgi:hypothetical protein
MARRSVLLRCWLGADNACAQRLRTYRIGALVELYYAKAKEGRARRRGVMSDKDMQRTLSAYFGGDWLALLDYLGEQPHDDEEVTRALPQPRLMVTSTERAQSAASAAGISSDEVQRILAAYWRQSVPMSPIEMRVSALQRLWSEFDAIHARQAPGMKELEVRLDTDHAATASPPMPGSHSLSQELQQELRRLWGTTLNARFPEHLVTEASPGWAAATAIGPALRFWDFTGINAWHATEGRRAYKELGDEFEKAVNGWVEELTRLGCPIDVRFFADLRAVESELGPMQTQEETISEEVTDGFSMSLVVATRGRRSGYERLRDVITHHRRAWAEQHLTDYFEARWTADLQAAGKAYHRHAADRGKPPTLKQFAQMGSSAAAHWFAGDLSAVYTVLGLPSPMPAPTYQRRVPENVRAFKKRLRAQLTPLASGGNDAVAGLASHSLTWLALLEALGRPPELPQFGRQDFKRLADALAPDIDTAWRIYANTIMQALEETESSRSAHPDAPQAQPPTPAAPGQQVDDQVRAPVEELPCRDGLSMSEQQALAAEPEPTAAHNGRLRRLFHRR